jgi:hypothetical protein
MHKNPTLPFVCRLLSEREKAQRKETEENSKILLQIAKHSPEVVEYLKALNSSDRSLKSSANIIIHENIEEHKTKKLSEKTNGIIDFTPFTYPHDGVPRAGIIDNWDKLQALGDYAFSDKYPKKDLSKREIAELLNVPYKKNHYPSRNNHWKDRYNQEAKFQAKGNIREV